MIKEVMIATDGSETSEKAAKVGIETACRSGGRITVVYVVDVFRLAHLPGYAALPGLKGKLMELMQKRDKKQLNMLRNRLRRLEFPAK